MTLAQAQEITRLHIRIRQLEDALARQKSATSTVADRAARLGQRLRLLGYQPDDIERVADGDA